MALTKKIDMDMDEDQNQAYVTITSGHNLLLTGNAGTGKTFVVKSADKFLREKGKRVALTCSTGLATTLYEDAFTLHKWAGLGDGQYSNGELLHVNP